MVVNWVTAKVNAVEEICEKLCLKHNSYIPTSDVIGLLRLCHKYRNVDGLMDEIQTIVRNKRLFQPEGLTWDWAAEVISNFKNDIPNKKD